MIQNDWIAVDYPIFEPKAEPLEVMPLDKINQVLGGASAECLRSLPYSYAQQPWLYFIYDGNCLKCLGTNHSIPCHGGYFPPSEVASVEKIYPQLFSCGLTSSEATPVFEEIATALRGRKFTSYYNTLMNFKWNTGLRSFPLFDLQSNIQVIDGRLWGVVDNNGTPCRKLLTDRIVNQEIKRLGGRACMNTRIKRALAKELFELHRDESNQEENSGKIEVITPFCRLSYDCLLNWAEVTRHDNFRFNIKQPSSGFRDFLHGLTGGDKKRLDDFAELLARLYRPELLPDYLWCIVGEGNDINWFLQLLCTDLRLCGYASGVFEESSDKALIQFLENHVNQAAFQINAPPGNSKFFKKVNHSHILRFITGDIIGTLDDPYIIKKEVVGKGVLIYAALELSEDCVGRLPHKVIRLPDDCASFKLNADDIIWMQTCLLCHGLYLLSTAEAEPSNDVLGLDQALRKFVTSFCELRPEAWTDRKHFYAQFKHYCDTCVAVEGKIPGSTKFAAYVEKELCWTSTTVRSNNNRLAFDGVALDGDKLERAIQEVQEHSASQPGQTASEDFDAYVDSFKGYLHNLGWQGNPVGFSI